jgi:hypothetical protein
MIYHFPDLQRLDTLPVTHKSLKDLADVKTIKSKQFNLNKFIRIFIKGNYKQEKTLV